MFCNKCGTEISDQAHYCTSCGAELIDNIRDVSAKSKPRPASTKSSGESQEYYEEAIGYKNADFYLPYFSRFDLQGRGASWNWPAFFISFYWLLYRKMWALALLYFLMPYLVLISVGGISAAISSPGSETIIGVGYLVYLTAIFIAFPMYANALYYRHANKIIIKAKNYSDDKEKRLRIIATKGGTSSAALVIVLIFVFISFIGILAAIAIPAYQDYTIRAKVSEGLSLASAAKLAVFETYYREGAFGSDNAAVGLPPSLSMTNNYVSDISVSTNTITITYKPSGMGGIPAADSMTITLVADSSNAGTLTWDCTGGSMPNKYRPSICRQ